MDRARRAAFASVALAIVPNDGPRGIALRQANPVDMAHYDSGKSPEGRAFGCRAIWRRLRPVGILISDDVSDNLAFKRFAEEVRRTPTVVAWNGKYQGILIR